MNAESITSIIKKIQERDTYKKIFINGKWGIGKSFYTNQYIKNRKECIYISLFGKVSIKDIEKEIIDQLLANSNRITKILKNGKGLIKKHVNGGISFHGFNLSILGFTEKRLIQEYKKELNNGKILIIMDDLERKSNEVSIKDISGLIEQLTLLDNVKIIVIGDETKIEEKEIWKLFKEKIIEKEYLIDEYSKSAIYTIITNKTEKYIEKSSIKEIEAFIKQHNVGNLRTIDKGVKLFLEILDNIQDKQNKKINYYILKTSLAVTIEFIENLYPPKKEYENSTDMVERVEYANDENIMIRIERHYFNSSFNLAKESVLIPPVVNIFQGNCSEKTYKDLQRVIIEYISKEKETEEYIFYKSKDDIIKIIKCKHDEIVNKKYNYTSMEKLINDINDVLIWNRQLKLKIDEDNFLKAVMTLLFDKYFTSNKENLEDCLIDNFELRKRKNPVLNEILNKYNEKAEIKYFENKFQILESEYKNKTFDVEKIRWIENIFVQSNREEQFKLFIKKCKENNYFITDISGKIVEKEWYWIHYIWHLFYKYLPTEYKTKFYDFFKNNIAVNDLSKYRFSCLNEYKKIC